MSNLCHRCLPGDSNDALLHLVQAVENAGVPRVLHLHVLSELLHTYGRHGFGTNLAGSKLVAVTLWLRCHVGQLLI